MRRLVARAGAAALVSAASAAGAVDRTELIRPCFRNLTPDARALLRDAEDKGRAWKASTARPTMLIRSQLYYGLHLPEYIHSWYERPLYGDTSLPPSEPGHPLNGASWKITSQVAREMKLDGFAFFPMAGNPACGDLVFRSQMPGAEAMICPQFGFWDVSRRFDEHVRAAGTFLGLPNVFRIDGKVVILGFDMVFRDGVRWYDVWRRFKAALDERYGTGKFALLPEYRLFSMPDLDKPEMSAATLEQTRAHLRSILREWDGIFYNMVEFAWAPPEYVQFAHDTIVAPLVRSVLSEPEFKGKLWGVEYYQAHENPYRRFGEQLSHGLTRLRQSLETVDRCRPDFALGSEWDEQNENVHFRPTVSNGRTTQRIMRYYADRMDGAPPTPFPGDDVSVPNLVLSYRKTLSVGEPLEAQVVNIPDGTGDDWSVSFRWKTCDGKTVRAFPPRKMSASACAEENFVCSSVDVADNLILLPELTVESKAMGRRTFDSGFWPMDLQAVRNLDSKWVRHALREICTGVSGSVKVVGRNPDGSWRVSASASGPRRFRSVEVLEGPDSVYLYETNALASRSISRNPHLTNPGPPTADEVRVSIRFRALNCFWKEHSPTGWIRIAGAPHAKLSGTNGFAQRDGDFGWLLPSGRKNRQSNFWPWYEVALPMSEARDSEIEVGLPEEFGVKRVKVAELVARGAFSFAMKHGGQMAVLRRLATQWLPPPCMVDRADFTIDVKPLDPAAVLRLQVVDEDYRIWRSLPASFYRPSGECAGFHVYDETVQHGRRVSLDRSRLYEVGYDFKEPRGDLIPDVGGRDDSPCVPGGSVSMVTGVASGGCWYHHALSEAQPDFTKMPNGHDTAPRCVREEDGSWSLAFSNCSFATLPMQFVPRYSGFSLSMRLFPDRLEGRQWIYDSGNLGFRLWLEDGEPVAFLSFCDKMFKRGVNETAGITVRGPKLNLRQWNSIQVLFDQEKAFVAVNGKDGAAEAGCGFEYNPFVPSLGCDRSGREFFCGRIADLKVVPR